MTTVRDLMNAKGNKETYSVSSTETVYHAIEVMAEANIGAVLVTDEKRIVGICTERDYTRKIILKGLASKETQVKDIMTKEVITVAPETTVEQCMALMTKYRFRHLPVVENGHLTGVISIGDVVQSIIKEKESEISGLQEYIQGIEILR
jgi:CBS domain-containing protein